MAQLKAGSTVGGIKIATTQDVPEKATQAEAVSGTDNNKYMTPFLVSTVLDSTVKSVNNKTGDVVLNADDVGAPTIQQHNELSQQVSAHLADYTSFKSDVGNKNNLLTSDKTSLVAAINEVFTTGNNVKSDTVGALLSVDDSLPITNESTWQDVINAIGQISTGKKWASGLVPLSSAYSYSYNSRRYWALTITELSFTPSIVIISYDALGTNNNRRFHATYRKGYGNRKVPVYTIDNATITLVDLANGDGTSSASNGTSYMGTNRFSVVFAVDNGNYPPYNDLIEWIAFE